MWSAPARTRARRRRFESIPTIHSSESAVSQKPRKPTSRAASASGGWPKVRLSAGSTARPNVDFDRVARRLFPVDLTAKVALSRINTIVAKRELDLLDVGAVRPGEFGKGPPQVVRRNSFIGHVAI